MTSASILATTVLGMDWYVLLFVLLVASVLIGAVAAMVTGGKLAGRGRRSEGS